ncbi:hypothetical protein L5F43_08410 [Aliarcobacter butzleri]|uniref:hypothetical protein n=2 Tax=Aliarcobacter butzleri TaxID=28197 RepID=UPI001EDB12C1|nr:hypothetical protein [Aliarcobacter butzleri]MCG3706506.1 hypothetical protein [Aliarcobacter butzleri]
MKSLKYMFIAILCSFIFSGCSNKYEVTFDSNPRGATLICNGKNWGYTPKKLYYSEEVKNYSSLDVSSCSANWVSGYKATYPKDMLIFPTGGTVITLDRPTYGEGYPMDAQFALQVEQMEAQQSQAAAMHRQANEKALQNMNQNIQNMNNNLQMQEQNYQINNINNNLNNINKNLNQMNNGNSKYYNNSLPSIK